MDEGFGMNVLDSGDKLVCKEKDGLQRELSVAEVEQVLQTGSKKVQNHGIVITFCAKPANEGDSDTTSERFVDTCFVLELRVLGFDTLEFDGNFFARDDVGA